MLPPCFSELTQLLDLGITGCIPKPALRHVLGLPLLRRCRIELEHNALSWLADSLDLASPTLTSLRVCGGGWVSALAPSQMSRCNSFCLLCGRVTSVTINVDGKSNADEENDD